MQLVVMEICRRQLPQQLLRHLVMQQTRSSSSRCAGPLCLVAAADSLQGSAALLVTSVGHFQQGVSASHRLQLHDCYTLLETQCSHGLHQSAASTYAFL
jgi:hypothetical protein